MSKPPCIEVGDALRGHSTDEFLEGESAAMSHDETKLVPSVLVVSAYPDHRAALIKLLASENYRLSQAHSATDALEKIKTQKFDLVVTGIQMRHMDGLELLRIVRETAPTLPVIAIGDANPEMNVVYLRCAELLGVFHTHSYPPDADRFLDSARRAIHQRQIKP